MSHSGGGSDPPKLFILADFWGHPAGGLFGRDGEELNKLLLEAGISLGNCHFAHVVNACPPFGDPERWLTLKKKNVGEGFVWLRGRWASPQVQEGLKQVAQEIELVRPNVILALGNAALWAVTENWGVLRWRGSQLTGEIGSWSGKVIPTLHPAAVIREWPQRPIVLNDLKRVAREIQTSAYENVPKWVFTVRPSFAEASTRLEELIDKVESGQIEWIDFDLETRAGHVACAGFSWSAKEALSLPLMVKGDNQGYWSLEEEARLIWLVYKLLTHPKVKVRGQNLLYDAQYTYRHWHFVPRVAQDTMIAQHAIFCGMPKSLDFLASMHCDYYRQWKPEKTSWKTGG